MTDESFKDRTMVVSGGSRGIGLAIALGAARRGANVVLLAKTAEPHPRLPGTVHTAAAEIEQAGGRALAVVGDVRNEEDVQRAVDAAVQRFGGVDICVNNASAISTDPTEELSNSHILTISPPMNMNPYWLGVHPSYTLSKYGMTLLALGWAVEYADSQVSSNCLWPETYIATAAVANSAAGAKMLEASRSPEIMADAAVDILARPPGASTGQCFIDSAVLTAAGVADLSRYGGGEDPIMDIFVDK